MSYTKRYDGRKADELRPIQAKVGVIKKADGSAMFQIGDTKAVCAVYGPRELHPKFMQSPETAVLRCKYDMMAFSVTERIRPGQSRRSKELGMIMESALKPVLMLEDFPKTVVDVIVEIVQADAGTRCAAISAAALALADAGIMMKDMIAAVAVGKIGNKIVLDITKKEEDYEEGATDIPIAYAPNLNQVTLLQLDGAVSKDELKEAIKLGIEGCRKIYEAQKQALKEKYDVGEGVQ